MGFAIKRWLIRTQHISALLLGALSALVAVSKADGDCPGYEYSCLGRCYDANYFSVMQYGHELLNSAPGSISRFFFFFFGLLSPLPSEKYEYVYLFLVRVS